MFNALLATMSTDRSWSAAIVNCSFVHLPDTAVVFVWCVTCTLGLTAFCKMVMLQCQSISISRHGSSDHSEFITWLCSVICHVAWLKML